MKRFCRAAIAAAAALLIAGCAAQTASEVPPDANTQLGSLSVESVTVDERSDITRDEYEAAYAKFADCMSAAKVPLTSAEKVGSVYQYSYPSDQFSSFERCYLEFAPIDRAWQILNEYENSTQVALRGCLEDAGIAPEKTVDGVWEQIHENKIDPVTCTSSR